MLVMKCGQKPLEGASPHIYTHRCCRAAQGLPLIHSPPGSDLGHAASGQSDSAGGSRRGSGVLLGEVDKDPQGARVPGRSGSDVPTSSRLGTRAFNELKK